MEISDENKKKGFEAESKFREWLEKHNIPYLYLQQDTQTISIAFKKYFSGKRPEIFFKCNRYCLSILLQIQVRNVMLFQPFSKLAFSFKTLFLIFFTNFHHY